MIKKEVSYNNDLRLNARLVSVLVQKAEGFSSTIKLIKGNKTANLKSILGVLWLKITNGDKLILEVEGADEREAAVEIAELIEDRLSEIGYCEEEEQSDCINADKVKEMLGAGLRKNLAKVMS
ncbi:MAG: HPr family phosphocarrier protein [Halanaerobacter sp.]